MWTAPPMGTMTSAVLEGQRGDVKVLGRHVQTHGSMKERTCLGKQSLVTPSVGYKGEGGT